MHMNHVLLFVNPESVKTKVIVTEGLQFWAIKNCSYKQNKLRAKIVHLFRAVITTVSML